MTQKTEQVVVVTRRTRFDSVRARFGTAGQLRFVMRQERRRAALAAQQAEMLSDAAADAEFESLQAEDVAYDTVVQQLRADLDIGVPLHFLDRELLPTYDFRWTAAVVAVGQDGLVANTAKYIGAAPLIGVNPDPGRYDGVLLPFQVGQAREALRRTLQGKARVRSVTLAEAVLGDGQRLLAFNDFFVGCVSHTSALYSLSVGGAEESQSSSGVLVSTGAGSTGWMSSVFNMARGVARAAGAELTVGSQLGWEDRELLWAVREPFVSKQSCANLVCGRLSEGDELVVESRMGQHGVVFSDGVERDALPFVAGTRVTIRVAGQRAHLVVA